MRSDRRDTIDHYRNLTACPTCALKPRCTPDTHKRVKRWQHEDVLDRMQARLKRMPEAMRKVLSGWPRLGPVAGSRA